MTHVTCRTNGGRTVDTVRRGGGKEENNPGCIGQVSRDWQVTGDEKWKTAETITHTVAGRQDSTKK